MAISFALSQLATRLRRNTREFQAEVRRKKRKLVLESLEGRQLMAAVNMTDQEQLLLELVNRARLNPTAEAARYGVDLNQGLAAGSISSTPKQALAPNQALINAAGLHAQDMLDNDYFSHTNLAGQSPSQRGAAQGYTGGVGENIGWGGSTGPIDNNQHVYERHRSLFLSPGHRSNMMYEAYDELGTGVRYGVFTTGGVGYNASMAAENFGVTFSDVFITGVAYTDAVTADNFYTIGESVSGLTVRAVGRDGSVYATTTGRSGGYALRVPAGTYTLAFEGAGRAGVVEFTNVVVGTSNIKLDVDTTDAVWDDYGPINQLATSIGTLAAPRTLEGNFRTGSDQDYIEFIAATTGTVTMTLAPVDAVQPSWVNTGFGGMIDGMTQSLPVIGGQTYRIGVASNGSAGRYRITVTDTVWTAIAATEAASFGGNRLISTTDLSARFSDDLVAVDPSRTYTLTGDVRSGNDSGGEYAAGNRQYFGFASYDADQNLILPLHVSKFAGSADTRLATALNPGDTQIVLLDATGWNNGGSGFQRALSWFGYTNRSGYTYSDYTYTRNVAADATNGLWNAGAIQGNVITLRTPWSGPRITAGTAVRNASDGATFNYAVLSDAATPNQWTTYSATISGTGSERTQFRPGTAFVQPLLLTNYHGSGTNLVRWRNVEVQSTATAGQSMDLATRDAPTTAGMSFLWRQVAGRSVSIENANQSVARIQLPASAYSYQVTFELTQTVSGVATTKQVALDVQGDPTASFAQDATTFSGDRWIGTTDLTARFGDDLIAVDPARPYTLTGEARSGGDTGSQYVAGNRQYFGFASYDADQNLILPLHVAKFEGSTDTRLAADLRPGDTQIVLQNAGGWNNAGAGFQRALAWFGYANRSGFTYADYTYTRNVAADATNGLWNAGGISGNTITLRSPWNGPTLTAGTAVRNATDGATFNYAVLSDASVANQWTTYATTLSGNGNNATQFRHGTAFIRPLVLANYHGSGSNLIQWRNIEVQAKAIAGQTIDVSARDTLPGTGATYQWRQIAGRAVGLTQANQSVAKVQLPASVNGYQVIMEVTQTVAGTITTKQIAIDVQGDTQASSLRDKTLFNGEEWFATSAVRARFGDRLVAVDPATSYTLAGEARSGMDSGAQYFSGNSQYFGYASYDADQNLITPLHVAKFAGAADTRLAVELKPGDTQIVLQDATGWNNGGAGFQRAFAWYGYTNRSGITYADYTYTRNVLSDATNGAWNAGGIVGNVITLRTPWAGPRLAAGTAVRNATDGATFNYAVLNNGSVGNQWTTYAATLSGVGTGVTQFRPGTAFIQPIVLANYHGGGSNVVQWRKVEIHSV